MGATLQQCRIVPIPGSPGTDGTPGGQGAAGSNAWGSLAAAFTMPGQGASGVATLDRTDWLAIDEPVWVEGLGILQVTVINGALVTLLNLQDGTGAYAPNMPPGTVAPSTSRVTPSGFEGPAGVVSGAAGGDLVGFYPNPLLKNTGAPGTFGNATTVPRLTTDAQGRVTGVTNVAISYPGTGGAAGGDLAGTYPNPVLAPSGVTAGAYGSLQLVPQITVDAKGRITVASGLCPRVCLLGQVLNASTAGGADIVVPIASARYRITQVLVDSPSADVSLATLSILNGAGSVTVCSDQALTDMSATNRFQQLTLAAGYKVVLTDATALFRIGTPVAAQSLSCRIYGENLA